MHDLLCVFFLEGLIIILLLISVFLLYTPTKDIVMQHHFRYETIASDS